LVLVTDRRVMGEFGDAVARAVDACGAANVVVQVREKDVDGGELLKLVRAAMRAGAPVMVNDRLDVALAAGAAGVHLPENGLAVADARRLAPAGFLIGCSRHTVADALACGADLVQLGPIFETPGKGAPLGVEALRAARGGPRLVAVGGVTDAARAAACRAAGADAVATIRAAWQPGIAALL
jgi:thiamine-phosphate pyrophosphorylase